MKQAILILQIIISAFLMAVILLQAKGTGLGRAWGGGGEFYRSKRGVEKILFRLTIILAVLFFIISIASAII
ncbi:preprotein translocase subunit SecG [Candidatus Shapirobacteria bacterium CG10_big_fil_rev_8_21_14_0_10_40_9]|uniref:Protein-export membrane protein SecG n=1 Tax=Candidatus Shapirobacteria bacterium CG10_big_fil_rev_8_21_14_0_10_40_9 TaxID=1974888 RepID=A0A2M8L3X1_9BACT|nr:MAG: preprotein translocase subunit SecG [Candidatus Shapirobacteria bacterium CG10_big_fil_rev_8_21_14_0_10_40_9]